jgi:hypothetical protein
VTAAYWLALIRTGAIFSISALFLCPSETLTGIDTNRQKGAKMGV